MDSRRMNFSVPTAFQPPGEWQFININEPKKQKKDEAIRRIVRANAMRDFRRKQKDERQALAQAHAELRGCEGYVTQQPEEAVESLEAPQLAVDLQYFIPEYMPGFLGDERLSDKVYDLCAWELKQLLGNLESMSLTELTRNNEAMMAQQVQEKITDPPMEHRSPFARPKQLWCMDSKGPVKRKVTANPNTLLDSASDPFNAMPISGNRRYVLPMFGCHDRYFKLR